MPIRLKEPIKITKKILDETEKSQKELKKLMYYLFYEYINNCLANEGHGNVIYILKGEMKI